MNAFTALKAINKAKNLLLDMKQPKNDTEDASPTKDSESLLHRAAQTVKNVNKARNVLLDVKKSRADAERLSVGLKSKTHMSMFTEKANYRAEKELNLSSFKLLLKKFMEISKTHSGKVRFEEFAEAFSSVVDDDRISVDQLLYLFNKIDVNTDGLIDWDDFTDYMLLRAQERKTMQDEERNQLFGIDAASAFRFTDPLSTPHRDNILNIKYSPTTKKFLTVSKDGIVCYWSENFRLLKSFKNVGFDSNKKSTSNQVVNSKASFRQRWALDFVLMENVYSIAISTDDHEISFYGTLFLLKLDSSTLEKFLILNLRDHNALKMHFWKYADNLESDKSRLVYGSETGYVCVYDFPNRLIADRSPRKKDTVTDISIDSIYSKPSPNYGILQKRKAHSDWVTMVRYYHNMKCVVSSSIDPVDSLVVATEDSNGKWNSSSTSVPKGVNCFAYSSSPIALVTGGRDHQIRIFNPRNLQTSSTTLKGHSSAIVDIKVNSSGFQIISLSMDKEIKVWDFKNHQCVQTITDSTFHKPDNMISCIKYSQVTGGALIAASSMIRRYKIREKNSLQAEAKSHDFPVRNLLYCKEFNLVVSGCNGGLVNVWDVFHGLKNFRFIAHSCEITAMAFDLSRRRLVTGGRDGSIRIWSYNTGKLLHELIKEDRTEWVDFGDTQCIAVTGWNRRLTLFDNYNDHSTSHQNSSLPAISQEPMWHKDDVLSMSFCPPNMMATSSYDGLIVITNIQSGHVIHTLDPFEYETISKNPPPIDKVLFLNQRAKLKNNRNLVSAGSDGFIRLWDIYLGKLVYQFDGTRGRQESIYCLASNETNSILVSGDTSGHVCIWDISNLCVESNIDMVDLETPSEFRAHIKPIVGLVLAEDCNQIITSSTDCSVRLFSMKGDFVGIFGQSNTFSSQFMLKYPDDVKALMEQEDMLKMQAKHQESKSRETLNYVKPIPKSKIDALPLVKDIHPDTYDLSPSLNTWYAKSIFAKEILFRKVSKRDARLKKDKHGYRCYHNLDSFELEAVKIPKMKLDFSGL